MKETKCLIIVMLSGLLYISTNQAIPPKHVFAKDLTSEEALSLPQPIHTKSEFSTKLLTEVIKLDKPIQTKDDPESEIGEEKVLEEGTDGKLTQVWKITLHLDKEYDKELLSSEKISPKPKVVAKGTKIVWRNLQTGDGEIKYWRKMRVWATHYDSRCLGCDEWTAIGMRAGKGVIAVDPKIIKLRSRVYIPGYGLAIAGDTGGAIKGNIIDLGFEDTRTARWNARYVDIYLLD